jgi:hypothetical protein
MDSKGEWTAKLVHVEEAARYKSNLEADGYMVLTTTVMVNPQPEV